MTEFGQFLGGRGWQRWERVITCRLMDSLLTSDSKENQQWKVDRVRRTGVRHRTRHLRLLHVFLSAKRHLLDTRSVQRRDVWQVGFAVSLSVTRRLMRKLFKTLFFFSFFFMFSFLTTSSVFSSFVFKSVFLFSVFSHVFFFLFLFCFSFVFFSVCFLLFFSPNCRNCAGDGGCHSESCRLRFEKIWEN